MNQCKGHGESAGDGSREREREIKSGRKRRWIHRRRTAQASDAVAALSCLDINFTFPNEKVFYDIICILIGC